MSFFKRREAYTGETKTFTQLEIEGAERALAKANREKYFHFSKYLPTLTVVLLCIVIIGLPIYSLRSFSNQHQEIYEEKISFPNFEWSADRAALIQIYKERQKVLECMGNDPQVIKNTTSNAMTPKGEYGDKQTYVLCEQNGKIVPIYIDGDLTVIRKPLPGR